MQLNLLFLFFLLVVCKGLAQGEPNDCVNYIQICSNQTLTLDVNGPGAIQEVAQNACSSGENHSIWLRVTIYESGTFGFDITPQSANLVEDYDFWVYDSDATCDNLGTPLRCSTTNPLMAGLTYNTTGINDTATDISEGPGPDGDSYVQNFSVLAGESYFIVLDRPIGNAPFSITWTGTAIVQDPFLVENFPIYQDISLCDPEEDGLEFYDFSIHSADYLAGTSNFGLTYYNSLTDANTAINPIIGNQPVSDGVYYIRNEHDITGCFQISSFNVTLSPLVLNTVVDSFCESDFTTLPVVDLNDYLTQIYTGNEILNFSFFENLTDAQNNINAINTNYQLQIGSNSIFIRAENSLCLAIEEIQIELYESPILNTNLQLTACSEAIYLGAFFNLNSLDTGTASASLTFYESQFDAQNNQNAIADATNYWLEDLQHTLFVKVVNQNNCFSIAPFELFIYDTPYFVPDETLPLCSEPADAYIVIRAELVNPTLANLYTYQWSFNGVPIIGATTTFYLASEAGVYTVVATSINGCESTRTITVEAIPIPIIDRVEVEDLMDVNSVSVFMASAGSYLYSLDGTNYQASSEFNNVAPGFYTVYVQDEFDCSIVTEDIIVVQIPNYFTPNGDGINDYWNLVNANSFLPQHAKVIIFDRFSKVLKQMYANDIGWDGTFNGHQLPSTDYWYTIELSDGRLLKGHFTLKR